MALGGEQLLHMQLLRLLSPHKKWGGAASPQERKGGWRSSTGGLQWSSVVLESHAWVGSCKKGGKENKDVDQDPAQGSARLLSGPPVPAFSELKGGNF